MVVTQICPLSGKIPQIATELVPTSKSVSRIPFSLDDTHTESQTGNGRCCNKTSDYWRINFVKGDHDGCGYLN